MSTCISRHGEFSEHELDGKHTCTLCGVLDEDAMRAELEQLRGSLHVTSYAEHVEGWKAFCHGCSDAAQDYVWPCKLGQGADMPELLVSRAELDRVTAELGLAEDALAAGITKRDKLSRELATVRAERDEASRKRDQYQAANEEYVREWRRQNGRIRERNHRLRRLHCDLIQQNYTSGLIPSLLEVVGEMGGMRHDEIECACELVKSDAPITHPSPSFSQQWEKARDRVIDKARKADNAWGKDDAAQWGLRTAIADLDHLAALAGLESTPPTVDLGAVGLESTPDGGHPHVEPGCDLCKGQGGIPELTLGGKNSGAIRTRPCPKCSSPEGASRVCLHSSTCIGIPRFGSVMCAEHDDLPAITPPGEVGGPEQTEPGEAVPEGILRIHPGVPAEAWTRVSANRYQAPHGVEGFTQCAVSVFGETVAAGAKAGEEVAEFATLFEVAARVAGQRVSCENGTPIVRPANEANEGVVGRCWWCGNWPSEHAATASPVPAAGASEAGQ